VKGREFRRQRHPMTERGRKPAVPSEPATLRVVCREDIPKKDVRRILVRVTNWVGDAVMNIPALEAIKENFPASTITILAKPWVVPLFDNHPAVDHIFAFKKTGALGKDFREIIRVVRCIRRERFDLAILFQNAFEAALLARLGGVRFRLGYNTDARGFLLSHSVIRNDAVLNVHQVEYYLSILRAAGLEATSKEPALFTSREDRIKAMDLLRSTGFSDSDFLLGISPGAIFGGAKRWPSDRFARIGDWAVERWGAKVLVLGSRKERDICAGVSRLMTQGSMDLCGRTSLGETLALISRCRFFLTNDSGLMHVAAAFKVPTVAVFGPTDPVATGPLGMTSRIVRHDIACAPCMKPECPTDHRCMESIGPEEVWEGMKRLKEELI
jgi:heptosyltransferase-2